MKVEWTRCKHSTKSPVVHSGGWHLHQQQISLSDGDFLPDPALVRGKGSWRPPSHCDPHHMTNALLHCFPLLYHSLTHLLHSKTGHHDQQPCKPLFCSQGNYRKVHFYSWLSERNCFYDNTAIILCAAFTFCFLFPFSVIYSAGEKHINFLCMLWAFLPSRDQISMQWAGALQNWHRSGKISTAICRKQGSNEIALSCYGCNLGNLSLSHTLENNNHKTHNK